MKKLDTFKRWIVWLLLASLFAVACVFLSQWQFSRRAEAVARIELVQKNFDQPAANLFDLVQGDNLPPSAEWRPVSLTGNFKPEQAVLVRNRPYNGQPGFLQVIPFVLSDGSVIAIETGWLPTGSKKDTPDLIPVPSNEKISIIARLRPVEPTLGRDAPAGQLATINVETLVQKVGLQGKVFKNFYARASSNYVGGELPKTLPKPDLNEGNHLSYALQWILFALMAFGALWWAIRQEMQAKRIAADANYAPKTRKKVGDDDKAAEDAIS
jgi:cytochrome oxidase assembly protein ShyY1